jgi:hypothetical protein
MWVKKLIAEALLLALGSCSIGVPRTPAEGGGPGAARLASLLAGKVPGEALSCLRRGETSDLVVIDEGTIAYRNGRTVYVNRLAGGCSGLGGPYTLVMRTTSEGACRGDIAEVRDLTHGTIVGSCSLGDFIPYASPRN